MEGDLRFGARGKPSGVQGRQSTGLTDLCIQRMLLCMRTTLDIHDDLMRQARVLAAETGRTLTAVFEDGVRLQLSIKSDSIEKRQKAVLPTFDGGGLMPGVDLDSNAALLDIMDGDDAPV
jgi:hypothetical protein